MCVVSDLRRMVSLLICKLLWHRKKRGLTRDAVPSILSFGGWAVQGVLSERRAKRAEKKQVGGMSY